MVRNFPNEKTPLVPLCEECLVLRAEKIKWRNNRESNRKKIEKMWLLRLGQPQKIIYNEKNYVNSAAKGREVEFPLLVNIFQLQQYV